MADENTKRAAQEYLASRLSEEGLTYEETQNRDAAVALASVVWKKVVQTVMTQCHDWNDVTGERTFTCKETLLGDLRILCAGRSHQMTVHFDSKKRLILVKNTARLEHEPEVILGIEGYATETGRDARVVRNNKPVNVEMLILGQLRVLAGLNRDAKT